tara:strand:- start:533 stop:694 length:162 start_codon:yes stop_codon:yes gene_type:complete
MTIGVGVELEVGVGIVVAVFVLVVVGTSGRSAYFVWFSPILYIRSTGESKAGG